MDSDDLARDKGLSTFHVQHAAALSFLWELPFGSKPGNRGWADKLAGGWTLSGLSVVNSGHPFTPLISFNRSGSGVLGASASNVDRPNLKSGYSGNPLTKDPDRWYDPFAFELPAAGVFGNLGRNTLIGPGLSNFDFSLLKNIPLEGVSENFRVQFRMEVFNAFNHANFDLPGNSQGLTSASFIFTNTSGQPNLGATRPVRTTNEARELQFALKLIW
jgi:hypothetical protein